MASSFKYIVPVKKWRLGIFSAFFIVIAAVGISAVVYNLTSGSYVDANSGKVSIDLIEIIAESQSLGWWFSTIVFAIVATTSASAGMWFARLWLTGVSPLSVGDNQIFIWGKARFALSSFVRFQPAGEGQKSYISGTMKDGTSQNLGVVSLMDEEPDAIFAALNDLLAPHPK